MFEMVNLEITRAQAESLLDFIECEFIDSVRNNTECDNIMYLVNICDIYKQLKCIEKSNGKKGDK